MAVTRLAPEMDIRQYVASLDLNPDNVFYQRIVSNNVSTSGAQWQVTSPNKRSLLLSYAVVDWALTIRKTLANDTAVAFRGATDAFSMKPVLSMSNAMTSQTISVNGNSLTLSQPRRFSEPLSRMCVSKAESRTCYESEWWDSQGGKWPPARLGADQLAEFDKGLQRNEDLMRSKISITGGIDSPAGAFDADVTVNDVVISHQEPLLVPPFNAFAKVKSGMPEYMPWKHQSPVIPNIDRLEVDLQFNPAKLAAGAMFYRYARSTAGQADAGNLTRLIFQNLSAHLLLYWYEIPSTMSIPQQITLQTWNLREFQTSAGAINNAVLRPALSTDLLQLRSVPSLIILHARRNQDDAAYLCQTLFTDSDGAGTDDGETDGIDSEDAYCELQKMDVILGDRPGVVSTSFTSRELYNLTLKNSKYMDFSLTYNDWVGKIVMTKANTGVNSLLSVVQQSKAFIALQPKDIAEKISPGVFFPTSLQFVLTLRARHGACGVVGANLSYTVYVHVITGKHWLQIEPNKAQFQEQNIPLESALRASKPSLVSSGPIMGGLSDSAYTSRF